MRRRSVLVAVAAAPVAACGLSERPYAERRAWPLETRRPEALPPRRDGRVLLVRGVRAGPGLEARGLQSVERDGSIRTAFYEEWAVFPAQAVEDGLRRWLADSGLFAGVLAPGNRLAADLTLEGELTALWTDLAKATARATLRVTVTDQRRVLVQDTFDSIVPLSDEAVAGAVAGQRAALAGAFAAVERAMAQAT